jgi:hypothetical protein
MRSRRDGRRDASVWASALRHAEGQNGATIRSTAGAGAERRAVVRWAALIASKDHSQSSAVVELCGGGRLCDKAEPLREETGAFPQLGPLARRVGGSVITCRGHLIPAANFRGVAGIET